MSSPTPTTLANRIIAEFTDSPVSMWKTTARNIGTARKIVISDSKFAKLQRQSTGLGVYDRPRVCSYPDLYFMTERAIMGEHYPIHIGESYNGFIKSLAIRNESTFAEFTMPGNPKATLGYLIVPKGDYFYVQACSYTGHEVLMNVFVHRFALDTVQTTTRMELADAYDLFQIGYYEHESAVTALQIMSFTERA